MVKAYWNDPTTHVAGTLHFLHDSTAITTLFPRYRLIGKQLQFGGTVYVFAETRPKQPAAPEATPLDHETLIKEHVPFLAVHGNVMYDVTYQSYIDTPYMQKDVFQHTIQTYLDITVKNQYPFRVYFTTRFSNSPLFRNYSDANFLFNSAQFKQNLRQQLQSQLYAMSGIEKRIDSIKQALKNRYAALADLEKQRDNPAYLQREVERKERELFGGKKDSLIGLAQKHVDSLKNMLTGNIAKLEDSAGKRVDSIRGRLDSARAIIAKLEREYEYLRGLAANRGNMSTADIDRIQNPAQMQEKLNQLGLQDSTLPKGYKTLMAIQSFGIGRTILNYSELSAKNISIAGVQVEYNPSFYVAFAAGSIDYRFRDFIIQPNSSPHQYLSIIRVGHGMKDGSNVILTYYAGRRQLFNTYSYDTINGSNIVQTPSAYLMGFTVEGNYQLNRYTKLTLEFAKSSLPYYHNGKSNLLADALKFNDRSNEAYSVKIASFIPVTQTSVAGYYKRLGINFQSFSIFNNGSSQNAYNVRIEQPFFHRMLDVVVSVSSNDFNNPYIPQGFKSTTVFKSIQATFRKSKWPVLSAGYSPSSQLTKLSGNQYIQNLFYTFSGTVSHFYKHRNTMFNTSLVYTKFYNRPADSGFVYFNTKNILLSQTVFMGRFTLQLDVSAATNTTYDLYTYHGGLQFKCNKWLSIGGGGKYNKQTFYHINQLGYAGNVAVIIPKLGEIRLMADKGYIPGMNRQLVKNNTGRLTYLKTF